MHRHRAQVEKLGLRVIATRVGDVGEVAAQGSLVVASDGTLACGPAEQSVVREDLVTVTDDPAEACDIINAYAVQRRSQAAATAESTKPIEGSDVQAPTRPDQGES